MKKNLIQPIWEYLKDWKNLLSHSVVGILILAAGLLIPVKPIYRILILLVIITLNVIRMRYENRRKSEIGD